MMITVILDGLHDGPENMRRDVADAHQALGRGSALVRLYGWSPPCISLGHHQQESMVDLDRCRRDGIGVVQRPTGGGAILHADELTYCVTAPLGAGAPSVVYGRIAAALAEGLRQLGIEADPDPTGDHTPDGRYAPSALCFSGGARLEIRSGGGKIAGSAQRLFSQPGGRVVLQHGSILLGGQHAELPRYLAGMDGVAASLACDELRASSRTVSGVLGRPVGWSEAAEAVAEGFRSVWPHTTAVATEEMSG